MTKRIGFLATGSELTSGEVLNTNGQNISQILLNQGAHLGEHLIVDDLEENLIAGIQFLASRHSAVIITGGLGPTSDDRTRFALASFLNLDLVHHEDSWNRILKRFESRNRTPTDNNKIQALFPKDALIFPNQNGTADGCLVRHPLDQPGQNRLFFLLPGPPSECLPLFENYVLPFLKTMDYMSEKRLYRWKLQEVSESVIAEKLESVAQKYQLEIAYRASKPILHIKLFLSPAQPIQEIIQSLEEKLSPHPFEQEFPA
jgi:nicotinamide-nucleotide amidase